MKPADHPVIKFIRLQGATAMPMFRARFKIPQPKDSKLPPHPDPADPSHVEWLIDEGSDESFPASDPSSVTQPHSQPQPTPVDKKK